MTAKAALALVAGGILFLLLAMFTVAMSTSGSAVSGFGNGGNHIYADPTRDRLAELLVTTDTAPVVSDEVLAGIYDALERKATGGDLDAALVMLQVAALQRDPGE